MNKKFLLLTALISVLNADKLTIGPMVPFGMHLTSIDNICGTTKSYEDSLEYIRRCFTNADTDKYGNKPSSWNTSSNLSCCTMLKRINDNTDVFCTEITDYSVEKPARLPEPTVHNWMVEYDTYSDDAIKMSNDIRLFNRTNWQKTNPGKKMFTKMYEQSIAQHTIFNFLKNDKRLVREGDKGKLIEKDGKYLFFKNNSLNGYELKKGNKYSQKDLKEYQNNTDDFSLSYATKSINGSNLSVDVIQEVYKENETRSTGVIEVEIKNDSNNILNLYLTEQLTRLNNSSNIYLENGDMEDGWKIFEMGEYLLGNDAYVKNVGDYRMDMHITNPKYDSEGGVGIINKYQETIYNSFHSLYNKNISKRYDEQLLLKNTRIGNEASAFEDRYHGGLSKCYNFDVSKFKKASQVNNIRAGHFIWGSASKQNDYLKQIEPNKLEKLYFSMHKSSENRGGIYTKDGSNYNYSVNIRPSKVGSKGSEIKGSINKFKMHEDANVIEIKQKKDGIFEIELKNSYTGKNITRPSDYDALHISEYIVSKEVMSDKNVALTKEDDGKYILNCSKKSAIFKDDLCKHISENKIIKISEIADEKGRPAFQISGKDIIKGGEEGATIEYAKPVEGNIFIYTAFSTKDNNTKNFADFKILSDDKSFSDKILTSIEDNYIYFVIENKESLEDVYFNIINKKNGVILQKQIDAEFFDISHNTLNKITPEAKKEDEKYQRVKLPGIKGSSNKVLIKLDKHKAGNYSLELDFVQIKTSGKNANKEVMVKTDIEEQFYSVRHKAIIYDANKNSQKAGESAVVTISTSLCAEGGNPLVCTKATKAGKEDNLLLTYASLMITDEKSADNKKVYLYLDDGMNILNKENASSSSPRSNFKLSNDIDVNLALPIVTKAKIRLLETNLTKNDMQNKRCQEFNEDIINIDILNKIDLNTGKIYCQTPMCKMVDGNVVCDSDGIDYEFESNGLELVFKDGQSKSKIKGIVPFTGKVIDNNKNLTGDEPLELTLYIEEKNKHYINFSKNQSENLGMINLDLSYTEKGNKKVQKDYNNDDFKNYVKIESKDETVNISSANECNHSDSSKSIGGNPSLQWDSANVNIGRCVELTNGKTFEILEKISEINKNTKLSDLLNDSNFKSNNTYGQIVVKVSYPKLDINGNYTAQNPFYLKLENGFLINNSNMIGDTEKQKDELLNLNKPSDSYLFTKTGLYFKDIKNNDGRLIEESSGVKYIDINGNLTNIENCNSSNDKNCCDSSDCSIKGMLDEDLQNKLKIDYKDSRIEKRGDNLYYIPAPTNNSEFIKDTIRFQAHPGGFLDSEKNSFTLEYTRK